MNPDLDKLHPYPFEKLRALKHGIQSVGPEPHIALSIGEPQHAMPDFIQTVICDNIDALGRYPLTNGMAELRQAIADWLQQRYTLIAGTIDADAHILPVNGTREALFSIAQAVINRQGHQPLVMMPNPFYQIYEGATFLAGAEPYYYATPQENQYAPDFDRISDDIWQRCQLLYVCTPNNPTGHVLQQSTFKALIDKAHEHNFVIVSDECYSEIYREEDKPTPGLLAAAQLAGYTNFSRCLVFNSLSKRSNLPGMRSGFIAGDAQLIQAYRQYRTYHGCAMSEMFQYASIAAWQDEQHVVINRRLYREKFNAVLDILSPVSTIQLPDAGFCLWLQTPCDDQVFARELYAQQNITVLPGSYLSRASSSKEDNPGNNHVRIALVAPLADCIHAAERIKHFIESL